jgi:hypothetical protein
MSQAQLAQKFVTPDGKLFDTKAEANDYLRRPLITAAMNVVTGGNKELTEWLIANEESVASTYESTKIQRVTKSEKKTLEKALDAIVAAGDRSFAFVAENKEAILESFRWPSVKRGTEEEQAKTIRDGFLVLTNDNAQLADWLIANQTQILEAYEAGVVKREVNPKAAEALAAYRANQAVLKAEMEAAVAADKAATEAGKPEEANAVAKLTMKRAAEAKAAEDAKAAAVVAK